jgi:hypothetical protein
MLAKPFLSHILDDDALTRGLGDVEARVLIEWLVDQAEQLDDPGRSVEDIGIGVRRLCQRGRAIGRFVILWCHLEQYGAAIQLAGAERFGWPLPTCEVEPDQLMWDILAWEAQNPGRR